MSFGGLQISLSALQAQRRALEVTGQNVANVATEGYSRQRVDMAANAGSVVPAIFATPNGVGQGVTSSQIIRIRDQFIEARANQEHATEANLSQVKVTLDRIELGFGEPGDNGLGAQLSDFLAGWDDVANKADDGAARSQLVERAVTLASSINQLDATFATIAENAVEQLRASTIDVNATAGRVAELNQRIQVATTAGLSANDLMDQRDLAASQLASSVGATVRPLGDGTVDVYVGGTALVRGSRANELEVVVDAAQAVSLRWVKDGPGGQPASVTGTAGGLVETNNTIVPHYRTQLARVAASVHGEVNALHQTGFDLDGGIGAEFFVLDLATGELSVNTAIVDDPRKVAASAGPTTTRDGSVAGKIGALTGTEALYRNVVVSMGVHSQTATRRVEIQASITDQIDSAREASSGVDVDEEMTNMLMYQHAYNAAARMMTTVDENLDTLINRMGA